MNAPLEGTISYLPITTLPSSTLVIVMYNFPLYSPTPMVFQTPAQRPIREELSTAVAETKEMVTRRQQKTKRAVTKRMKNSPRVFYSIVMVAHLIIYVNAQTCTIQHDPQMGTHSNAK